MCNVRRGNNQFKRYTFMHIMECLKQFLNDKLDQ